MDEEDLKKEVKGILSTSWSTRDGRKVPEAEDVGLDNDAVKMEAVCLYADMASSTSLVDGYTSKFAAKIYKSYLRCASRIIKSKGGVITSFDGDRVMGVFFGSSKRTAAACCALKINYAVKKIINPAIAKQYPKEDYVLQHAVGMDVSSLFVVRSGVRGSNDLVWIGQAANYAAKLSAVRHGSFASWMTEDVYKTMSKSSKKSSDGRDMWEEMTWNEMDDLKIYGSSWTWTI
jgi:class 3 adenylate cyclase